MNLELKPITALLLAATASLQVLPAAAQVGAPPPPTPAQYEGRDGNWYNPANWSIGRVPGIDDCVQLDGRDRVSIDFALAAPGQETAAYNDIIIVAAAQLTTQQGAVMESRQVMHRQATTARIVMHGGGWIGGDLITEPGRASLLGPEGGLWLDPSAVAKTHVQLVDGFRMQFGLGGRSPASASRDASGALQLAAGYGHYSTLTADSVALDGHLWLNLHHEFRPVRGDRFQLIKVARSSSGEFNGLPEGALAACTADGVGLSISYRGGDGNDVELIAADASLKACLAPTVQPLFQINRLISIDNPVVAQTREYVLLARQVGVPTL